MASLNDIYNQYEKQANEAFKNGEFDKGIEIGKKIPHSWDYFSRLPNMFQSVNEEEHELPFPLPDDAIEKISDHIQRKGGNSGFYFELAHNAPKTISDKTLRKLIDVNKDSFLEKDAFLKHPNFKRTEEEEGLHKANKLWNSYEVGVHPAHFAAVKSMFTGKPETTKARDKHGSSHDFTIVNGTEVKESKSLPKHGQEFEHHGQKYAYSAEHLPVHETIPHLENYAHKMQEAILNDNNIPKKIINGEPHILLHRGVEGSYAKKIRELAGHNKEDNSVLKRRITAPVTSFSSWSTDPEVAGKFAHRQVDGQPEGEGVVISKWHPVKSILSSGFHNVYPEQTHIHENESEIVVGHPEGKISFNTSELSFRKPDSEYGQVEKGSVKKLSKFEDIETDEPLDDDLVKSVTYEEESKKINESKKTPEAQKKHKFKAAKWTYPNGHPRCKICGSEEKEGGYCEGRLEKSEEDYPESEYPVSFVNQRDLLAHHNGVTNALNDNISGRVSKSSGPLHVHKLENGKLLLVDGFHRFADGILKGQITFPVKTISEGYSDYYATPSESENFDAEKFLKANHGKGKVLDSKLANLKKNEDDEVDYKGEHRAPTNDGFTEWSHDYNSTRDEASNQGKRVVSSWVHGKDIIPVKGDKITVKNGTPHPQASYAAVTQSLNNKYLTKKNFENDTKKLNKSEGLFHFVQAKEELYKNEYFSALHHAKKALDLGMDCEDLFEEARSNLRMEKNMAIELLEKGEITNALKALGFAGALATGAYHYQDTEQTKEPQFNATPEVKVEAPKLSRAQIVKNKTLKAISAVESQNNPKAQHQIMSTGMHKGSSAIGSYGLMPITIREMVKKNPDLNKKYGHLANVSGDTFKSLVLHNPETEHEIASKLYDNLASKFGHHPEAISHAWFNGVSGTMKALKDKKDLGKHWHVRKIMKAYENVD